MTELARRPSGFSFERILGNVVRGFKREKEQVKLKKISINDQEDPLDYGSDLSTNPSRLFICHSPVPML